MTNHDKPIGQCFELPRSAPVFGSKLCADAGGTIKDFDLVNDKLLCIACSAGLNCPVGGVLTQLENSAGTEDLTLAFVKKGFISNLPG